MKKDKILEGLIYLVIFFIPLYLVRIKIGKFPTNVLEILVFFVFIYWIFIKKEKIFFGDFFKKYLGYSFFCGMIFFGILFSTFFSGNSLASWGIIKSWFFVPIILVLLIGKIIKKEKIEYIFMSYFFSATTVAIISLGYLILNQLTYDRRLVGIFNSPNYLAMYLAPAIIIGLEQMQNSKLKRLILFSLFIIISTLYFTYSYSAWISIVASMVAISLIKNRNSLKKIVIIIAIFLVLFLSQINNKKLTDLLLVNPRSSLSSRIMIWKASEKMIEDNFWLGIGPGNFQEKYLEYQKFFPPYLEWAVPHPNNLYLTWWLYGGVLGLVGFLGLVFLFLRDILKRIYPMEYPAMQDNFAKQNLFHRVKKEPNGALFMSLGIMLIILIHGVFDTTYFKNDLAIIFWLNFLVIRK